MITAKSQSDASAGEISLDVDTLALTNGAQIFTSSFKGGDAGSIAEVKSQKSEVRSQTLALTKGVRLMSMS
ncbi:hypothetical protein [Moorena sp. SIO3B2]|uniref:hypothetical protein n=1 Tax=Moorena sp. SIO3B2 TaxID=2607827 RepID=UPI0013C96C6C|nr:hypothetical protein [Moorena sp. SIO3B2]NEP34339.1 hypothetical protein [Moorena sp. SIO3B2]